MGVVTLSAWCQGCGVFSGLGAGIGGAVPRYADVAVQDSESASVNPAITSDASTRPATASTVRRKVGTHWAEGFGIGLAIDLALMIAGVAEVIDINSHPWGK